MSKKAPNPELYWQEQAKKLKERNIRLYDEVESFVFKHWEGESISYQRQLSDQLIATLGNPYGYAKSSFVTGVQKAIHKLERDQRQ